VLVKLCWCHLVALILCGVVLWAHVCSAATWFSCDVLLWAHVCVAATWFTGGAVRRAHVVLLQPGSGVLVLCPKHGSTCAAATWFTCGVGPSTCHCGAATWFDCSFECGARFALTLPHWILAFVLQHFKHVSSPMSYSDCLHSRIQAAASGLQPVL
jgi:hypothetical protein